MAIQNLGSNQSFTSNSLVSRPQQNFVNDKVQIENAPATPVVPAEPLKTLFSIELKSTLDRFGSNKENTSQSLQNPLQQYQSVSEFEEIDGLSTVIGIDVTV